MKHALVCWQPCGPTCPLWVSYPTVISWVEFLTAVLAIHFHCIASLVGTFAIRPVILNISVKVLYPTIVCSSLSIATQVTANLPLLVSQILDFLSQKHLRCSILSFNFRFLVPKTSAVFYSVVRFRIITDIKIMKYTTVKISEIAAHPTMRLDPGYWLKKEKKIRPKRQAASDKLQKNI